jgi:hypothetical protein
LSVPAHELAALDWAARRVVGPENYQTGQAIGGGDEATTISIMFRAPAREGALVTAGRLYDELRATAKLPPADEVHISLTARVGGVPTEADQRIFEAQTMRDERRFGLAIVEAQTHCEMHMRWNMEQLAARHGPALLRLARLQRMWTLMDDRGQHLFEALCGRPAADFDRWEDYRTHVQRRNNVVHRGARVSREDAEESIEIAVQMVRFVELACEEALAALDAKPTGT